MSSAPQQVDTLEQHDLDTLSINTIRFLAVDAVQQANSGHPGLPMGAAPMAYVLWTEFLRHNPADPTWPNRDRFVLSAGHGSMLLYALLHLTGYDLPMEEIKNFRQLGSKTPGHPENFITPGVETTTGPLGQGFANGVGMAIAERMMAAQFNRDGFELFDHYTYALVSDGDLMEGISHEAASLAGHLGLGKLIYLYDDNKISIDGSTDLTFTEDVGQRFEAYGWHVQHVEDGTDRDTLADALRAAQAATDKPSIIAVRTVIGHGSPNRAGTAKAHGEPLGEDEIRLTKENLGWPPEPAFFVPGRVYTHFRQARDAGQEQQAAWNEQLEDYRQQHPGLAARLDAWLAGTLPAGWEEELPTFDAGTKLATRAASGKTLDKLVPALGNLVGGSADLTGSNKTKASDQHVFQPGNWDGSYLYFGVREHAMASICNGIALHSGLRPYCGTFLIFSDYLRPALRLSALMSLPVVYVFTHDSVGLGEDGPTHQAVEHYMALRAIPNLTFIRPADANETAEAWKAALRRSDGPTALALTRQGLPTLDRSTLAAADGLQRGAYTLRDTGGTPDIILIASGSEVSLALGAAEALGEEGVAARVVSMPSWELFAEQSPEYRDEVLPPAVTKRLAVEAGVTMGWERYVGAEGGILGLDRFGTSAPGAEAMRYLGFTVENVVEKAKALLG